MASKHLLIVRSILNYITQVCKMLLEVIMPKDIKVLNDLKQYCYDHGLSFETLPTVLNEPKVVPMVRGVGYEYVVLSDLQKILKGDKLFEARKTIVNSQMTNKGSDVEVLNKNTNKIIRIECKLASNRSFAGSSRTLKSPHCKIKIMRSRTLGDEMIRREALKGGATIAEYTSHKDSYLPNSFDFVVTNLRNAFYITTDDDLFTFQPTEEEWVFLKKFFNTNSERKIDDLLKFTHYYIKTNDLVPRHSDNSCNRRTCQDPDNCYFIPNYPIFRMSAPMAWKPLDQIREDLVKFKG